MTMEVSKRDGLRSRHELSNITSFVSTDTKEDNRHMTQYCNLSKKEKRRIKKVMIETSDSEVSNIGEDDSQEQENLERDESVIDVLRIDHSDVTIENKQPEEAEPAKKAKMFSGEAEAESEQQEKARQENDDVLSVVIQKLTELVNSSESLCTRVNNTKNPGCSSGDNTPPKAVESMKKPRKRRHKSQLYKCPNCPCLFAIRKRDLKKEKKILCTCCEKLKRAKAEALHEKLEKNVSPLQVVPLESWKVVCDVCSQWVSDYTSLMFHLASHTDVQIFKCKLCDFVTTKKGHIESHQTTHRPTEISNKFVCTICKFAINNFAKMEEHLKSHDQKKLLVLKCSVCGYTCRSEEVLRYHMVTHIIEPTAMKVTRKCGDASKTDEEGDMGFKCTVCGYSCDKLSTLKSHSWRHAGDQSCSYPVEEIDRNDTSVDTTGLMGITKSAECQSQGGLGLEENEEPDNSKDLSRLAIGCCGTKGQACCSNYATGVCQCKSIDVPASQQPLLEVILHEIISKTTEAVSTDSERLINQTVQIDKSVAYAETADASAVAMEAVNHPPPIDDGESKGKEDREDEVEDVLDECSTLITNFCDRTDADCATPEKNDNMCRDKQRLIVDQTCGKCEMQSTLPSTYETENPNGSSEIASSADIARDDTNLANGSDDGSIIVVVESMGFASLLEDTASVVEVTTSEEPDYAAVSSSPSHQKEDVKNAIKRLLTTPSAGEPSAKKVAKNDVGISNLLLNVVEDLVEKPKCSKNEENTLDSEKAKGDNGWTRGSQIQCPFCTELLSSFISLKKHLLDHCREEIMHSCPSCPAKFTSEKLLMTHQKDHLVSTKPACEIASAGKSTDRADQIQQVQEIEGLAKTCTEGIGTSINRNCSMCGRKFRTKASLYLHEQECTTQKKIFPCIECDFVCSARKELNQHLTESHKKPFKCALCDYTSATPSGIKNHMKFHAVDKPYKCHLCPFSGAYPQSLRSHLKVHTSSDQESQTSYEQYKCKLCGYISCHLPSMKSHMWRHARDPGFDYNMVDEIIKDGTPCGSHDTVGQQSMIYITSISNMVMPTQDNKVVALARQPEPIKISLATEMPYAIPASGSTILIYKCTQCGFQSNSKGNLVDHLKAHLAVH